MLLHEEGQRRKIREQLALINAVACGFGGGKEAEKYIRKLQDSIMTEEEKQARIDNDWGKLRQIFSRKVG